MDAGFEDVEGIHGGAALVWDGGRSLGTVGSFELLTGIRECLHARRLLPVHRSSRS